MNRFQQLFRHDTPPPPGKIYADDRSHLFPGVVAGSPKLQLWPAERDVPQTGTFFLIGVATWSGYDMALLDLIDQTAGGPDVVGVFNVDECLSHGAFERRIPGIGEVYQTPVVGFWQDGRLTDKGTGFHGRQIAARLFGIDEELVHQRITAVPS